MRLRSIGATVIIETSSERLTVSVVIPCHNSTSFVGDAIESALEQTIAPHEILVIDDGSSDHPEEVFSRYDGRIRIITQKNAGVSAARNRGIREATGKLIAFLDADDRWLPHKLARQLEYLSAHPDVALVHTDLLTWISASGEKTYVPKGRERFQGKCYEKFFFECRVLTSTVLVRKTCLEDVGLFDDKINTAEDLDLWLRLARRWSFGFISEPLVLYRKHDSNVSKDAKKMAVGHAYVYAKALREDPTLNRTVGAVHMRMAISRYMFEAGYWHYAEGSMVEARNYFFSALKLHAKSADTWAFLLATMLPDGARKVAVRGAKLLRKNQP